MNDLEQWKADAIANLDARVATRLRDGGYKIAEIEATLARTPEPIKRAAPRARVVAVLDPAIETERLAGFGISGGAGSGKSSFLAAMFRERLTRQTMLRIAAIDDVPALGDLWTRGIVSPYWLNWPDVSSWIRPMFERRGHAEDVARAVDRYSRAALIILDDVGRERIAKGGYDEDVALAALDRILDARSRDRLPIFWTTNLTPDGLLARYGAALYSRLCGLAPLVVLPDLPDLRLEPPPA